MTTFEELRRYEGKRIISETEADSVYAGRVTHVSKPDDSHHVALANFNYERWFNCGNKLYQREFVKKFPFKETDKISPFTKLRLLTALYERKFIQIPRKSGKSRDIFQIPSMELARMRT